MRLKLIPAPALIKIRRMHFISFRPSMIRSQTFRLYNQIKINSFNVIFYYLNKSSQRRCFVCYFYVCGAQMTLTLVFPFICHCTCPPPPRTDGRSTMEDAQMENNKYRSNGGVYINIEIKSLTSSSWANRINIFVPVARCVFQRRRRPTRLMEHPIKGNKIRRVVWWGAFARATSDKESSSTQSSYLVSLV